MIPVEFANGFNSAGDSNFNIVGPTAGNRFYRLHQP